MRIVLATVLVVAGCRTESAGPDYGAATQLVFMVQPSTTAAFQPIAPAVKVEIRDAQGRLVANATSTVHLDLNGASSMAGSTSAAAVGGVATFSNILIPTPGTGYTLTASSLSLVAATSQAFNVTAGTPGVR